MAGDRAYDKLTGAQIGFARAVSDGIGFAALADVIVDPSRRGEAVGKSIMQHMIDDGPAFHRTLFTRDAHGLYERFGFQDPDASAMVRPPRTGV